MVAYNRAESIFICRSYRHFPVTITAPLNLAFSSVCYIYAKLCDSWRIAF